MGNVVQTLGKCIYLLEVTEHDVAKLFLKENLRKFISMPHYDVLLFMPILTQQSITFRIAHPVKKLINVQRHSGSTGPLYLISTTVLHAVTFQMISPILCSAKNLQLRKSFWFDFHNLNLVRLFADCL